jgi:hypothetical protein
MSVPTIMLAKLRWAMATVSVVLMALTATLAGLSVTEATSLLAQVNDHIFDIDASGAAKLLETPIPAITVSQAATPATPSDTRMGITATPPTLPETRMGTMGLA